MSLQNQEQRIINNPSDSVDSEEEEEMLDAAQDIMIKMTIKEFL